MNSQEQRVNQFQQVITNIIEKSESQFTSSLKRISQQYINDYTINLDKEINRIAS